MWYSEDPREFLGEGLFRIVIFTGGLGGPDRRNHAMTASVNTYDHGDHHGAWSIETSHTYDRYRRITADDSWPEGWLWCHAPERQA